MAKSTKIVKVDRRGARCTLVRVRSAGYKNEIEVPGGMAEFREWIRERVKENEEFLVAIGLAQWLAKNPGSTDFSGIEGKTISIDLTAATTTGLVTIV
jgi:hypothetical protein